MCYKSPWNDFRIFQTPAVGIERREETQRGAHLQQLWHNGQDLRVTDVDGVVSVGLLLVTDVPQVEDRWQQGKDPDNENGLCHSF